MASRNFPSKKLSILAQRCCDFYNMFCHSKGAPELERKDARGGASTAALQLQEQRGKRKLVEGDKHSLCCHCSRSSLSTKLYFGSSWNKPFHSPSEGKGKAQGTGLFCCEKQLAAQSKSLPRTPGTFGL